MALWEAGSFASMLNREQLRRMQDLEFADLAHLRQQVTDCLAGCSRGEVFGKSS